MEDMKFSVVTVCFNAADCLEDTIKSVVGQTHPAVEYIVVDGGSTDGSADIIRRYASRLHWWCSEPDGGIYDAMNKALGHCTGRYVCFMNAGDRFASPAVLAQVAATAPSATVLYGNTILTDSERGTRQLAKPRRLDVMPYAGVFCHQSALIDVAYHQKHPYDTEYRSMADYDFFRTAYLNGCSFVYIDTTVSEIDNGKGMSKNIDLNYREKARILNAKGLSLIKLKARRWLGKARRTIGL